MKRNMLVKMAKKVLSLFIVATFFVGSLSAMPQGILAAEQEAEYEASYVQKLENAPTIDITDYIDDSVMFQLGENVTADEEISVIVTLDVINLMDAYEGTDKTMSFSEYVSESDEATEVRKAIKSEKTQILGRLDELGIAYELGEDYDTLLSGFEILIKAGDYEATCQSLGDGAKAIVGEEYEVAETKLVENTVNVYDTGIFKSEESGYDGSGMVVAVLDTGLDSNHSAFSVENFTSDHLGLTYEDVAAVVKDTAASELVSGLTVDDVYINEKVPFGFDYADSDSDPYSTHNNHGTHVSGVIVGKDDTITGVAPNAQLVSMKIFSDVVDTARSAWILAALEDCVVLDVDVINMSLGTACGFSHESEEELLNGVYDRIRDAGISMIVAASNSYSSAFGSEKNGNLGLTSNPDTGTVGSPSTYDGVMSVASIAGVETPYIKYDDTIIYFSETTTGAAEENDFFEALLGEEDSIKIEYVLIPGVGRSADYTGIDVTGKIALVRRGSNTFEEKAIIAQEQGAAGIIIYNNVSGDIKMNVGDATLAACSISQDDGELLAAKESGTLVIAREQTSGPFISDFSSWGPTPDLKLKPEITAHGGSILSSVTGGSYDRLSGTSMACPNLAGVVILLRQYVVENFPEIADDNVKVNAMVFSLLMSTADIALNTNGLPYSVRKQGAGLANLMSSIETTAYISTYNEDGSVMDKAKLELGDDPEKTGVYEMKFTINNFGDKALSYEVGAYVMTEGVSETKTNAGETTVTEEAYLLDGATVEVTAVEGGTVNKNKVKVKAGENATVTVLVTLSDSDKAYLDESFENGMYVEGFITLEAKSGTDIDLSVPYLAYYGDWTVAPLFDLEYFETHADEIDDGIDAEDKTMADAYATRPIGGVSDDYVSYLGTYYFLQDPEDMQISATKDYIALSNQIGTIHSLRFVWAGLLRNAEHIDISITDDVTGEVIFEKTETDVRKSYGDGGASIYPANVEIEFDTVDYNLVNNSEYTVKLVGYLDYADGGIDTNERNEFEFPLTIDFEAPAITDVRFYYEYDKTLEKNRLYAEVGVYDNHYAMASQLGYVTTGEDEEGNVIPEMKVFEQYLTPVYSERDSVTYVTYELTDYIYKIKEQATNKNSFVLTLYDYALNYATYEIGLPTEYTDFYYDGLEEGITLSPNEVFSLEPLVYPTEEWAELLEFASSRPSVVRIVNNKLVAVSSGKASVKIQDPATNESIIFDVTVLGEDDEGYRRYDKPVADVFTLDGYDTINAYYRVATEDKEIGDEGSTNFFQGNYSLSLFPSETVCLNYTLDAYFPSDTTVEFETSNENIVTVDAYGNVTAVSEGFASVTIKVMQDGRSTYYSETVSVEVKDPYITTGATLTNYYGNGGLVDIPERLKLTEIGSFSFSNYEYVMKTEEELAFDDAETSKQWFIGDNTITKVIIPEGVEKINSYAFANLTALEEVVLPSTLEAIEYGAFYNCTSLKKLTFNNGNNLKIINQNAFEGCALEGVIEMPELCVISDYAFAGNQKLEGIVLSDKLLSIGQYAFAGCKKLTDVTIGAAKVKYGAYAFTDCESLTDFYVNAAVLPEGMFYECESLTNVTIGPDVNDIGSFAFKDTKVATFEISDGNKAYKVQNADYILSADGTQLVAVSPVMTGEFTSANIGGNAVTTVAKGAFSHNSLITSIVLDKVTSVGEYAFASNPSLVNVVLGDLTSIGEYAYFETSITTLPAFTAETEIGKYAFSYTDITSVTIPDNTVIEEGVFSECSSLAEVIIGNDVTIGKYAFNLNKDESFEVHSFDEDGERYFYYEFTSPLTTLTIGNNAVIGENAFTNAASLETVTLGENAEIGYMAFYNNSKLKNIDLSKAKSIGDYAFSGDVYYVCYDDSMTVGAVGPDGYYRYTYHAPALESIDLSVAESVGEYAFAYCRDMKTATLNSAITEIPQYAFAGCITLEDINLSNVKTIGDYAFMEDNLLALDLSAAETLGEYAFVRNPNLTTVKFNEAGTDMAEGTFAYCELLATTENLAASKNIGDYAFAYTALTEADLTGAVSVGTQAFLKEVMTPFKVTLGENIEEMGDNPFAMCDIESFCQVQVENFNGVDYETYIYDYEISPNVSVINGSLYCKIDTGLELITYAGPDGADVKVADDTVRITGMAFAGSDVVMVRLPYTVAAIGHKAFFDCDALQTVIFTSYEAPILEEEFDSTYFESFEHIPGAGNYGTYTDYDGNEVNIDGIGLVPYYMWNITDGLYFDVYYGANFIDYVGYVEDKLTMIRPVNGVNYDSYIYNQYFDLALDGATAADDVTLAAINAIKAIPAKVTYEQSDLVATARELYTKIATTEQQALVTNYADLISAEQRITALTPTEGTEGAVEDTEVSAEPSVEDESSDGNGGFAGILFLLLVIGAGAFLGYKNKEQILEALKKIDTEKVVAAITKAKEKATAATQKMKEKAAEKKAEKEAKKAEKEAEKVAEQATEKAAEKVAEKVTTPEETPEEEETLDK
ncbi:MAG: leucine-rich repeat protein [Roseburia sp.]|nr:leucine-rich repeat protein [Roseburia sp.]